MKFLDFFNTFYYQTSLIIKTNSPTFSDLWQPKPMITSHYFYYAKYQIYVYDLNVSKSKKFRLSNLYMSYLAWGVEIPSLYQ